MNNVSLTGRITREPELKITPKPKEEVPAPQEPSTFNPKYQTPQNQNTTTFTIDDKDLPF